MHPTRAIVTLAPAALLVAVAGHARASDHAVESDTPLTLGEFIAEAHPDADPVVRTRVSRPEPLTQAVPGPVGSWSDPFGGRDPRGLPAPFVFTGSDPEGDAPSGVVFTPDGSTIIVAHRESRNLILWDADTRAFIDDIPVSGFAQAVDVSPNGQTAVVALLDDAISVVDLNTNTEIAVLPAAENPGTVAISPAGDLAAVGLGVSGEIVVVDLFANAIVRTIPNIGFTQLLAVAPEPPAGRVDYSDFVFIDDDRVMNVDRFGNQIQFVDVRTGAVTNLPVADQPAGFSVTGDGESAAIAHAGSVRTISLINLATESVISTHPTLEDLRGPIATNQSGTIAAVAISNAARVYDLKNGTQGASLSTASINEMLPTPDRNFALGVGFRGAVIDMNSATLVDQVNNVVSTDFGAMSPAGPRAAMFSTTFGDDMVVVNANGAAGFLEAFQLSGPLDEGDRCRTVAISPDGTTAVGVSILSDSASIVDVNSATVTAIAQVGQRPSAVAVSPDGTTAVVGNLDSTFATVIDLGTGATTDVPISRRAGSVAISQDSRFAYLGVVASGDGVWRIDLDTNTVAGPKILTGNMGGVGYSFSQTSQIALSPDGSVLAVAGSFDDVVSLIDTANWTFFTDVSLPAGSFPTNLGFSPDGETLYVANRNTDSVAEIDLTLAVPVVTNSFNVGDSPWQVIGLDDGFVVNVWGDSQIRRVLSNGGASTARTLPQRPVALEFDPSTGNVGVAFGEGGLSLGGTFGIDLTQSGTAQLLDIDTLDVLDTADLGDAAPSAMAVAGNGNAAFAAPTADGMVVLGGGAPPCVADFNDDGAVNILDVLDFITVWNAQGPGSDFNNDGMVNILDVVNFITEWQGGCP